MDYKNKDKVIEVLNIVDSINYLEKDLIDYCRKNAVGKVNSEVKRYFANSGNANELAIITEYLIKKKKELIKELEEL